MIDIDHQMSAAGAVARPRQQARQGERPERDDLGIESRACQQFEMPLHIRFAGEGRYDEGLGILAADTRECDRGVVNRKRQINLYDPDGTRIELMEANTVDGKPAPTSIAPPPHPGKNH